MKSIPAKYLFPCKENTNVEIIKFGIEKEIDKKNVFLDFTSNFRHLQITEDLLLPILTGKVTFEDKTQLIRLSGIQTDDVVRIEFKSLITNQIYTFRFKISNYETKKPTPQDPSIFVILDLISENYKQLSTNRSISFNAKRDENFSKWLRALAIKNYGFKSVVSKENKFEKGYFDTISFPYMNFYEIIGYINDYARSKYNCFISYTTLFASQKNDSISFPSLFFNTISDILSAKITNSQVYHQTDINHWKRDYNMFNSYDMYTSNFKGAYSTGGIGGVQKYFDFEKKSEVIEQIKYEDVVKREMNLGNYSLFEKTATTTEKVGDSYVTNYNDFNAQKNYSIENNIVLNSILNGVGFHIDVMGYLERQVGTLAYVYFDEETIGTEYDKFLSGKYLLKTIVHIFTGTSYTQRILMLKNGFMYQNYQNQIELSNKNIDLDGE